MKHLCVVTLLFLCVLPVFLWPMEESWHPLPAALGERTETREKNYAPSYVTIIIHFSGRRFRSGR